MTTRTAARAARFSRATVFLAGSVLIVAAAWSVLTPRAKAEEARTIPAPVVDEAAGKSTQEVAVLAGGCFWGVQGVFQHVAGVTSAVSGYAGGDEKTAKYRVVGSGSTGHAESVRVTYDPRKISYGKLLQIYFSVAHDPTELNRQGPDTGTQYRSTIFPANADQARIAKGYIDQLNKSKVFGAPIVTTIESDRKFYPAEDYHQDFLTLNPTYPYIVINDLPKVDALKRLFPEIYKSEPVLVAAKGPTK
ncbi:MAG TPA: peptide-methionine (S)-S-oxide reductase MsrA [Burkholderiales bacterium]|nr:peptide-methionine (S)-S-oxide reductase MsrA [Burkholderiales bacterium]